MKKLAIVLLGLAPMQSWAAYTYYLTDNLTSINTSNWTQAGSVVATSSGLTAPDANGGSLISRVAVPDGTSDYEVKATIRLTVSGGTYTLFARATADARTGGGGSGTYYAFEMQNPVFDGQGNCSANFSLLQSVGGSTTVLAAFVHSCRNGMAMRMVVKPGILMIYTDQFNPWVYYVSAIAGGQPGIGAYATPSGNSISQVQLGRLDRTPPPDINQQSVGLAAFPNHVDLQWQGVTDDSNGIGFLSYWIYRDGAWLTATQQPSITDETVSAGTSYSYMICPADQHFNFSCGTTLVVQAAPAGTTEPRRIGVRPTGSYWGAAGEQVDMLSGNLNFSVPLMKAQARGGWGVTLALSYNSQIWRQDSGGTWKLGRDVGYGLGWTLQAGSLRPAYSGAWDYASHCTSL